MDLKVSLDYVQTEESRYRKNAAIQIRQEVANVLKHARLSTEEESAAPAPAAEEKTGKEAAAGKTSAARSEKKAEAASEKKPFGKKPFEKKGKWGRFPWWLPQGSKSGRYLWKGFRGRAYSIGKYCAGNGRGYHPLSGYGCGSERNSK